ncbi:O-antigen ligase family protein [Albibacterium profundi]|uniref:O-antigen ligase family protein n=1 Tax=Albibacterium profundi TaxID=3134906 RepID=A0ABV5CD13_9SPHI
MKINRYKIVNNDQNTVKPDVFEKLIVFLCSFSILINHWPLHISYIVSGTVLLSIIVILIDLSLKRRHLVSFRTGDIFIVFIFLVTLFIGLNQSYAPSYGLKKFFQVLSWCFYAFFVAGYIRRFYKTFLICNFLLMFVYFIILTLVYGNIYNFFIESTLVNAQRLGSTYGEGEELLNPIWLSRYIGFLLISSLILSTQYKLKFIQPVVFFIGVLYMLASGSKGPIVAFLFAVFFFFRIYKIFNLKIILILSTIFIVSIISLIFYFGIDNNQYLMERFSFTDGTAAQRWNRILDVFEFEESNVVLGNGTGHYGYKTTGHDSRDYPHNIFVELLYENGILGVMLISILIFRTISKIVPKRVRNDGLKMSACFFLYFFLNSLTSGDLLTNQFLFLFMLIVLSRQKFDIHKTKARQ